MEVVDDLSRCPRPPGGTVVTIGAYDGVHLGHRRLIDRVRGLAAERGCASAVVTFDRHPALVVRPESAPRLLTDLAMKLELLSGTGLDYAVVVRFDQQRANERAGDFVRTVLTGCLAARVVVVGHDFHFGHNREGNVALLRRLGGQLGFEVLGLSLFEDEAGGGAVSSTRIRLLLDAGDVRGAAALLGRSHAVRGRASRVGEHPATVRLAVPGEYLVPAAGAYVGWYSPDTPDSPAAPGRGGGRPAVVTVLPTSSREPSASSAPASSASALQGDGAAPPATGLLVHVLDEDGLLVPGGVPTGVVEFVDRIAEPPALGEGAVLRARPAALRSLGIS